MAGTAWSMFYWNKNKNMTKGKRNKLHSTHPLRVTNLMASRHMRPLHGQGRGCSREGGVQGHPPSSPAGITRLEATLSPTGLGGQVVFGATEPRGQGALDSSGRPARATRPAADRSTCRQNQSGADRGTDLKPEMDRIINKPSTLGTTSANSGILKRDGEEEATLLKAEHR